MAVFVAVLLGAPLVHTAAAWGSSGPSGVFGSLLEERTTSPALAARGMAGDWDHVVQTVNWLRYKSPPRRTVYLLGGSATRESISSESAWAAQLRRLTGRSATTYVCATGCQTFVEDALIVKKLPRGRGSVLISVGTSRFIMQHLPASLPSRAIRRTAPGAWYQHHYDRRNALSYARKRRLVTGWVKESYPTFQARYEGKLAELEQVIEACEARRLRPVLLEMPLNLPVVGDRFHAALATYRRGCLALASEHGIPYIRFVSTVGLASKDFYDLQHLLASGRAKWQARLSRELIRKHLM